MVSSDLCCLQFSPAVERVGWVERSETHHAWQVMAGYAAPELGLARVRFFFDAQVG
jgi:hypothetical protein